MDPAKLKVLKSQLNDVLDKDFIIHSNSPWDTLVLFVNKKVGSLRMFIDYRQINRSPLRISALSLGLVTCLINFKG